MTVDTENESGLSAIEDVLFNGGMLPDVENLVTHDAIEEPELDMFGIKPQEIDESVDEIIENQEQQQPVVPEQNSEITEIRNTLAALQNQMVANNQQQQPTMSAADAQALQTGQSLMQLQQTKPVLYNKLTSLLSSEDGNNTSNNPQVDQEIEELTELLRGEKYTGIDVNPILQVLKVVKVANRSSLRENSQILQAVNQMQQRIAGLESYKNDIETSSQKTKEDVLVSALLKAESDFGIQIKQNSEDAQDVMALIRSGKDPRAAIKKIYGKTEADVVTNKGKKEIRLNQAPVGKKQISLSPKKDKLSNKLFGSMKTSADLFTRT